VVAEWLREVKHYFSGLAEQNQFLKWWEENVDSKRIHGTTCKQVSARFEGERPRQLGAASHAKFVSLALAGHAVTRQAAVMIKQQMGEFDGPVAGAALSVAVVAVFRGVSGKRSGNRYCGTFPPFWICAYNCML